MLETVFIVKSRTMGWMSEPTTPADVVGFTVVVCDGHRCHALRGRTDTGIAHGDAATLLGVLRECVRRSRSGVLIRSACLGACERAPAVCLVRRAEAGNAGVLFGPVESPAQVQKLVDAVEGQRR